MEGYIGSKREVLSEFSTIKFRSRKDIQQAHVPEMFHLQYFILKSTTLISSIKGQIIKLPTVTMTSGFNL